MAQIPLSTTLNSVPDLARFARDVKRILEGSGGGANQWFISAATDPFATYLAGELAAGVVDGSFLEEAADATSWWRSATTTDANGMVPLQTGAGIIAGSFLEQAVDVVQWWDAFAGTPPSMFSINSAVNWFNFAGAAGLATYLANEGSIVNPGSFLETLGNIYQFRQAWSASWTWTSGASRSFVLPTGMNYATFSAWVTAMQGIYPAGVERNIHNDLVNLISEISRELERLILDLKAQGILA